MSEDFPFRTANPSSVPPGIYAADCNQWGAVSVRASNGKMLGLKWPEFEPLEWEDNPHIVQHPGDAAKEAQP